jgi:hypothetical protein
LRWKAFCRAARTELSIDVRFFRRLPIRSGHGGLVASIGLEPAAPKQGNVRIARWFIFKPEIPIWVNFGGPWN